MGSENSAADQGAIDAALRIDSSLPLAHLALGSYYYHGFLDYARATEEYAIALAALPGDADVLFALAITQRRQGRWAEATANLGRAFSSNPRIPAIGETWVHALMVQRLYRQAEQAAEKALAINPANDQLATLRTRSRLAREQDPIISEPPRSSWPSPSRVRKWESNSCTRSSRGAMLMPCDFSVSFRRGTCRQPQSAAWDP